MRKQIVAAAVGMVFLVALFCGKLLWDSGILYRSEPKGFAHCELLAKLPGAEDMAYSRTLGMLLVSSDTRPDHGSGVGSVPGMIYGITDQGAVRPLLENPPAIFHPHGIDLFERDNESTLFVVNHRGDDSVVEKFVLGKNGTFQHKATNADPRLLTPNDVAANGPNSFYITQDHGSRSPFWQNLEHFTRLGAGTLGYFSGGKFTTLKSRISFANGIALDHARQLLYMAATLEKTVHVYQIGIDPIHLALINKIYLPAGPDNITLDGAGALWIGAHPSLFALKRHAENHSDSAPSLILKVDEPWNSSKVQVAVEDNGTHLSAASIGFPWGSHLVLGGIYEPKVLRCPLPLSY